MANARPADEGRIVYHPSDGASLRDEAFWAVARRANALARDLTGIDAYSRTSLGYHTKPALGHCRLCGSFRQLTFEHLPPKSAGNASKRRYASALDVLETEVVDQFPSEGVVIQDRGAGFHLLCKECNELLSNLRYVDEYCNLVGATAHGIAEFLGGRPESETLPEKIRLQVRELHPGRIVRQVVAMIMCASGSPRFGELFPALRDSVITGVPTELPSGMSLHLSVVTGPRGRLAPPTVAIDASSLDWQVLVEATFAPLSWVLRVGESPPDLLAADVSDWTKLGVDEQVDFDIVTRAGFVVGPMPLDYRHASQFSARA